MPLRTDNGPVRAERRPFAWIARVGAAAMLALAAHGAAADAPDGLVTRLERWLDVNSAYPSRAAAPRIVILPAAEAEARGGHATMIRGRLRGLYEPETATIILSAPWSADDPRDVAVLLHELAHHRMSARHWYCPQAQEEDAYRLQAAWLAAEGLEDGFYWPAIMLESSCAPRDIHPD